MEATPMLTLEILIPTAWFTTVAFVAAMRTVPRAATASPGGVPAG
jgi:hypothetical protein